MSKTKLRTTKEAAAYLTDRGRPVKDTTMTWWRARGVGPKFFRVLGRISYAEEHLNDFIDRGETDPAMK